jgi:hypothetical protein
MSKVPRDDKGISTPKKRARKATPKSDNGVHADNGNGALPQSVTPAIEVLSEVQVATINVEEQIRERAYELYLQRNGNGGSPEQDWLRARQEICGQ